VLAEHFQLPFLFHETLARVLELGCADGFATVELSTAPFDVTAVDFSAGMISQTRARLERAGATASCVVADINDYEPDAPYDAVLALMWTFFRYARRPDEVLRRLRAVTARKLLVDVNPRETSVDAAVAMVRDAGFDDVRWRPFLVPQRLAVPAPLRPALALAEVVPGVRRLPLRWRFAVVIKGERPAASRTA